MKEGNPVAILLGVLECDNLPNIFNTSMYDGKAVVCLVDRESGDFIMDKWHDSLGNIYEQTMRKTLPGYEDIDVREEISLGHEGVVAYESRKNGENSYMYYKPVESVSWHLIIVVQEDVAFGGLNTMRKMLMYLGTIEAALLLGYLIWTLMTMSNTINSKNEFERLSYTDAGTGAFNRQAFYKFCKENRVSENVGVVFCDITGLKKVNDTQGHSAGDTLIKNTYTSLLAGFKKFEVFRLGGDEFVIISVGRDLKKLQEDIDEVRTSLAQKDIVVAIGEEWTPYMKDTLEQMLSVAETKMYTEKSQWYRRTGNDRRRI